MSDITCEYCGHSVEEAIWLDAVKYKDKCYRISGMVKFNHNDGAYDLDELIGKEQEKIEGFNDETEELLLLSFIPNKFKREDIEQMNFGIEDIGPICPNCRAYIYE